MNHRMKQLTGTLLLLLSIASAAYAQNGSHYTFTTGSNASLLTDLNGNAIDMTTAPSALSVSGTNTSITLDFPYVFMGFRATRFAVTQNGLVTLGNASIDPLGNDIYTFIPAGTQAPVLSAYCASLRMATGGSIRYKVVGVAPARTLVVEFKGMTVFSDVTVASQDATYQVRIYEGSGIVEYVYGEFGVSGLSAYNIMSTVGFARSSSAFASVNLTNQSVTTTGIFYKNSVPSIGAEPVLNSTTDGSRRYFKFVPVAPQPPSSIAISAVTAQTMTVSWTPPADTGTFLGYVLYKSTDGATYTKVGDFAKNQLSYFAVSTFNTTSYWKVSAMGEGQESTPVMTSGTTLNPVRAVQSGNWNDGTVWSTGVVPSCTDDVFIMNGKTVNVNSTGNIAKNITVDTTAALAIATGGVLTSGCTGNNATVWNLGTLTVSGGTFNINGNLALENKSKTYQSGGDIIIDGNDNGNLATSVPTGIPLLGFGTPRNLFSGYLSPSSIPAVLFTGGQITIVDPHAATDSAFAFAVYLGSSFGPIDTAHTIRFGNGVSTDPAGSDGFNFKMFTGTTKCIVFGKAKVDVGTAPNRIVKSIYANGDVELLSGTWQAGGSCFGGNVSVNGGTLVSGGLGLCKTKTSMIGYGGDNTLRLTQTIPQEISISGSGTIVDNLAAPTANFGSLYILNSSASGITINTLNAIPGVITPQVSLSNSLSMTGKITMAPGSIFLFMKQDLSLSGQVMILSDNSGFVPEVTVARWYYNTVGYESGLAAGLNSPIPNGYGYFPFVSAAGEQRRVWLNRSGTVTSGIYAVTYHEVPGTTAISLPDATSTVNLRSNSYWTFSHLGTTPTATNVAFAISAPNLIPGLATPAYTHIIRDGSTVGAFIPGSTDPIYGIRKVLASPDLTVAPFYIGISTSQPVPVTLEYFKGEKREMNNLLRWKTSAETDFSHFELQRSANGVDFSVLAVVEPNTPKGKEYTYVDESPISGKNFYRLNMIDIDGKNSLSKTVELSHDLKNNLKIEISPVPVTQHLKIKIEGVRSGNGIVRIVNLSGKTVRSMTIAADISEAALDLAQLIPGIYTFEYSDENNNFSRKISKR